MDIVDVIGSNANEIDLDDEVAVAELNVTPQNTNILEIEQPERVAPDSRLMEEGVLSQVARLPASLDVMMPKFVTDIPTSLRIRYVDGYPLLINEIKNLFVFGNNLHTEKELRDMFERHTSMIRENSAIFRYGKKKTEPFLQSAYIERPENYPGLNIFDEQMAMEQRSVTVNELINLYRDFTLNEVVEHTGRYIRSGRMRALIDEVGDVFFSESSFSSFGRWVIDHVTLFNTIRSILQGPNSLYDRLAFTGPNHKEYLLLSGNASILNRFKVYPIIQRRMNSFGYDQVTHGLTVNLTTENSISRRLEEELQISATRKDILAGLITRLIRGDSIAAFRNVFSSLFTKTQIEVYIDDHMRFEPEIYVACCLFYLLYPSGMFHPDTRANIGAYLEKYTGGVVWADVFDDNYAGDNLARDRRYEELRLWRQDLYLAAEPFRDVYNDQSVGRRLATPFDEVDASNPDVKEEPFEYIVSDDRNQNSVTNLCFARGMSHYRISKPERDDDVDYQDSLARMFMLFSRILTVGVDRGVMKSQENAAKDLLIGMSQRLPRAWNDAVMSVTHSSPAIAANYFADPFPGVAVDGQWQSFGVDDRAANYNILEPFQSGRDDDVYNIPSVDLNNFVSMHLMMNDNNKIIADASLDLILQGLSISVDVMDSGADARFLETQNPGRWLSNTERYEYVLARYPNVFLSTFCKNMERESYNVLQRIDASTPYSYNLMVKDERIWNGMYPKIDVLYHKTKAFYSGGLSEGVVEGAIREGRPAYFSNFAVFRGLERDAESKEERDYVLSYALSGNGDDLERNVWTLDYSELRDARLQYNPIFMNYGKPILIRNVPYHVKVMDLTSSFDSSKIDIDSGVVTVTPFPIQISLVERYSNLHRTLLAGATERYSTAIIPEKLVKLILKDHPSVNHTKVVQGINREIEMPKFSNMFSLRRV
jgi:hypothetical protein